LQKSRQPVVEPKLINSGKKLLGAQVLSKHLLSLLSPQLVLILPLNIDRILLETQKETSRSERNSWGLREEL
jgi:hypothetical protein